MFFFFHDFYLILIKPRIYLLFNIIAKSLYIAKEKCSFCDKKGFGIFNFKEANKDGLKRNPLVLTDMSEGNSNRTQWQFKKCGDACPNNVTFSWNGARMVDENGNFMASPIGQEFVCPKEGSEDNTNSVLEWAKNLIKNYGEEI